MPLDGVVIRDATEADAEALRAYATSLLAENLPGIYGGPAPSLAEEIAYVRSRTAPANCALIVAVRDGDVLGAVDFVGGHHAEEAHAGEFGVSVARGSRGCGLGTRLVDALLAWAPTAGIRRVEVQVFACNPRALALYRRLGFEDEGVLREALMVDGEPVDMHVLARLLGSQA